MNACAARLPCRTLGTTPWTCGRPAGGGASRPSIVRTPGAGRNADVRSGILSATAHRFRTPGRSTIEILRVSGSSRPNSVAGAIAALLRNEGEVEVQAIGPHAVNQAVKAIAIARSYIEADGLDLRTVPSFVKLELQNEERTAVRFAVVSVELPRS